MLNIIDMSATVKDGQSTSCGESMFKYVQYVYVYQIWSVSKFPVDCWCCQSSLGFLQFHLWGWSPCNPSTAILVQRVECTNCSTYKPCWVTCRELSSSQISRRCVEGLEVSNRKPALTSEFQNFSLRSDLSHLISLPAAFLQPRSRSFMSKASTTPSNNQGHSHFVPS